MKLKKLSVVLLTLMMLVSVFAGCTKPATPGGNGTTGNVDPWADWTAEQNAEVRRALSLLIDREYIVKEITQAGQIPAYGFVPQGMDDGTGTEFRSKAARWWEPDDIEGNIAEAIEILKKYYDYDEASGKFTNFPSFEYSVNPNTGNLAIAAAIQDLWADYGITCTIDNRTWSVIQTALTQGDFTMSRLGWIADYNDPINFLEIFVPASGNNHPRLGKDGAIGSSAVFGSGKNQTWADAYDALITRIKGEADPAARAEMMYEAEAILRDTYSVLPLYYYTRPYLASETLKDYIHSKLGWVSYKTASMADGSTGIMVCVGPDPETIDPALNASVDGSTYLTNAFAGLYGFALDADGNVVVVPDSAEAIAEPVALGDGRFEYTIKLRDGLKWSDGVDVKASDFTYAWNRAVDPATAADYQYIFDVIDGYDATTPALNISADDAAGTVTVVTGAYCAYFDQLLAFPTYYPVREDIVTANPDAWATDPATYISNGAFAMKEWTVGSSIVFEKNEYYWNADNVKLETITYALSDDDDANFVNYDNNTYQMITNVSVSMIPQLTETRLNKDFFISDYIGVYFLEFNVEKSLKPGLVSAAE